MLEIPNVRYVPGLSESIYSLYLHIKSSNHGLESSYEEGLFICFPDFMTKAIIGNDNIFIDMIPIHADGAQFSILNVAQSPDTLSFCHHLTQLSSDIQQETSKIDNILNDLRTYYSTIKTKRQLGMNVPAGFRRENLQQQNLRLYTPPNKQSILSTNTDDMIPTTTPLEDEIHHDQKENLANETHSNYLSSGEIQINAEETEIPPNNPINTNHSSDSLCIPLVRSVDKVSSSLPKHISMTEDFLCTCVDFR
jgi:hypothetical protein